MASFTTQALSNILWAHASAGEQNHPLFNTIANAISSKGLGQFNPQELSNILWSYAKAEEANHQLFSEAATYLVTRANLRSFKPQDFSNITWAYATAGEASPKLFKTLEAAILATSTTVLSKFKPQELANTVWAFATADIPSPSLFKEVSNSVVGRDLRTFNDQNLTNITWAYASANRTCPRLFKKIADYICTYGLTSFTQQNLSNLSWSYAKTGETAYYTCLFNEISKAVLSRADLRTFNSQHLCNLTWAFATAKMPCSELFEKIADVAIGIKSQFSSQEVTNFLWAYAVAGKANKKVFTSFAPTVMALLESYSFQELTNTAWAFAIANVKAPALFGDRFISIMLNIIEEDKTEGCRHEGFCQLHQWQLWQKEIESDVSFPTKIQNQFHDAFIANRVQTSSFQKDVVNGLMAIGLYPEEEVVLPSGYSLDILVEINGQKIGIEADGPSHFIEMEPNNDEKRRNPTGKTILKRRQVSTLDKIPMKSIPYWDWHEMGTSFTLKQIYLSSALGLK